MANQEHVDLLNQGVQVWNQWRQTGKGQTLRASDISAINLRSPDLSRIILRDADLSGAILQRYVLFGADLRDVNLRDTNLSYAYLTGANLIGADLRGADLSRVRLANTVFAEVDLRTVKGLDTLIHQGPSYVDVKTVIFPPGDQFKGFLRGAGFSDLFIENVPSLFNFSIPYYSLFISYSSRDEILANRLHADLQASGVRCWFAPKDLKIGDKFRQRIDEAIHLQDKLLLLLSEDSITSTWVENEVEAALEKEDRQQREVLFPIRLDDVVVQTSRSWAAALRRTRHIGDFTNWMKQEAYQIAFDRLLRDLKKANQEEIEDRGN